MAAGLTGPRSGEKRASGRVVGRIGALECRSEPLGRSDRRPTGGADEREEVVPADEKKVYIAYILGGGTDATRVGHLLHAILYPS